MLQWLVLVVDAGFCVMVGGLPLFSIICDHWYTRRMHPFSGEIFGTIFGGNMLPSKMQQEHGSHEQL